MRKRIKILGGVMLALLVTTSAAAMYTLYGTTETTATTYVNARAETPAQSPSDAPQTSEQTQMPVEVTEGIVEQVYYWEGDDPDFTGYPEPPYADYELEMLAKTVWGEARGCSPDEQRLVIWTVFQRVDAGGEFKNYNTIEAVLLKKNGFCGYDEGNPIDPEIYALCEQEAMEWAHGAEPPTLAPYAVSAPYLFFDGDGRHNWFREDW